jgi:glycosyltransferase involved in cell wall biosynthesis
MGLATPTLPQNWLTRNDVLNLMYLEGIDSVSMREEILLPLKIPVLQKVCNRYLVRIWPFNILALSYFIVGRVPQTEVTPDSTVSVVVAARNEEGNIREIFDTVPEIGGGTEFIFVEGNSKDNTFEVIQKEISTRKSTKVKMFKQEGKGKGDAVRKGFANATGDVLMILDADLTVPPEDLQKFFRVLTEGKAEYANGVRLVYPMDDEAMRFFNFLGNKFFSLAFSWLLGRPIKDTLCGTKVMTRRNYEAIAANRNYFGEFDPFGDFDLIFGAAKLNLQFVDLPVRYRSRTYGDTNISRWRHGILLLKMAAFAMHKIKFV